MGCLWVRLCSTIRLTIRIRKRCSYSLSSNCTVVIWVRVERMRVVLGLLGAISIWLHGTEAEEVNRRPQQTRCETFLDATRSSNVTSFHREKGAVCARYDGLKHVAELESIFMLHQHHRIAINIRILLLSMERRYARKQ